MHISRDAFYLYSLDLCVKSMSKIYVCQRNYKKPIHKPTTNTIIQQSLSAELFWGNITLYDHIGIWPFLDTEMAQFVVCCHPSQRMSNTGLSCIVKYHCCWWPGGTCWRLSWKYSYLTFSWEDGDMNTARVSLMSCDWQKIYFWQA